MGLSCLYLNWSPRVSCHRVFRVWLGAVPGGFIRLRWMSRGDVQEPYDSVLICRGAIK